MMRFLDSLGYPGFVCQEYLALEYLDPSRNVSDQAVIAISYTETGGCAPGWLTSDSKPASVSLLNHFTMSPAPLRADSLFGYLGPLDSLLQTRAYRVKACS